MMFLFASKQTPENLIGWRWESFLFLWILFETSIIRAYAWMNMKLSRNQWRCSMIYIFGSIESPIDFYWKNKWTKKCYFSSWCVHKLTICRWTNNFEWNHQIHLYFTFPYQLEHNVVGAIFGQMVERNTPIKGNMFSLFNELNVRMQIG